MSDQKTPIPPDDIPDDGPKNDPVPDTEEPPKAPEEED